MHLNASNNGTYQWRIFELKNIEVQGQFFGTDLVVCKLGNQLQDDSL
jgi:hypothetical protein